MVALSKTGATMRTPFTVAITACFLAAGIPTAYAQQQPGFTPQQLDEMSRKRMEHSPPRNYGPPVPQSMVPADNLHQPTELLECMGIKQWEPIYAAPSTNSPVIGKTLSQIAAGGGSSHGFARVLNGAGKPGYVPVSALGPYHNAFNSGATCTLKGLRANGSPVFSIK